MKPTNTLMPNSHILNRVAKSVEYVCNVCGKEMLSKSFFGMLTCKNGHTIGETTEEGMLINAIVKKETHA